MSLQVENIVRSFGKVKAVSGITFEVQAGSVFGLLGPNGAGKTTTMRIILGIQEPDSGMVSWNGRTVGVHEPQHFGYLPEERGLYPKMRVGDQIAYFGRIQGLNRRQARAESDAWLTRLSIMDLKKRMCGELSKGNQQKVQLAAALVHHPELVILDEPFSGLDPVNAQTMLQCIHDISASGTTVVVSSHQMFQIEQACKNFVIMRQGVIQTQGTLNELRSSFPTRTVRVAPDCAEIRYVFSQYGYDTPGTVSDDELTYNVASNIDFKSLMAQIVHTGLAETFEKREPSLDQIYKRAITSLPTATN